MYLKPIFPALFVVGLFIVQPVYAETDAQLLAKGQWRDSNTGLIWMRCTLGQNWTGSACGGEPIDMNYQQANDYFELFNQNGFAGANNWRLPTIKELSSLRLCSNGWANTISFINGKMAHSDQPETNEKGLPSSCAEDSNKPAIDVKVFKNLPNNGAAWWWSSDHDTSSWQVWRVEFSEGVSSLGYGYKLKNKTNSSPFGYGLVFAVRNE